MWYDFHATVCEISENVRQMRVSEHEMSDETIHNCTVDTQGWF
jgi:hypothetical protein